MDKTINYIKITLFTCCFLCIGFLAKAQNRVSGTITDSGTGEYLPGVTILVKGTAQGTVTDINGSFEISASPDAILSASFLGYEKQEVSINNRSNLTIALKLDISVLEELVVLGYSAKSKKELSASITSLDAKELQNVTSPNIETMLQGKVSGLTVSSPSGQPGQAADIRIRGITSLNADIPPLFVVDGMIGGTFVPSDVESINVLKDAAAIGLYGSLGAAGVIIVTTKKGSGPAQVSYSSRFGIKQAAFGNFKMMNGAELYEAQEETWGDNKTGFLVNRPQELEDRNFDWLNAAFSDDATIQTHNLSVRGSDKNTNYGLSVEYFDEEGTLINTGYERLNVRANYGIDVNERFSVATDINAQINEGNFHYFSWLEDAFWNLPWDSPYVSQEVADAANATAGQMVLQAGTVKSPTYISDLGDDDKWYGQFGRNFVNSTNYNTLSSKETTLNWSFRTRYDITSWLTLETRTRLNSTNIVQKNYYSPLSDAGAGTNGTVYHRTYGQRSVLSTHFLRANKTFDKHDVGFFIAQEGGYGQYESLELEGTGLSSNTIAVIRGASTIAFPIFEDNTFAELVETSNSYISELSYGFGGKYFATAYYRVDGNSRFAANKKYGAFYGGSAAWLISDETFLAGIGALDLFKLRASYGLVGNNNIQPFKSIATYNITLNYNGQSAAEANNPANPNLGWETSKILNLGTDLELFNESLGINIDVYEKNVEGMLLNKQLAFSSGYETRLENIGDMKNRGIEIGLSLEKSFGDFTYNGNFNISFNENEITYVTEVDDSQQIAVGDVTQIQKVGFEAYSWHMPVWKGIDSETGDPLWELLEKDDDGNVTNVTTTNNYTDAVAIDNLRPSYGALPTYAGGFSNSLSYKNISLSFLFTFQGGNHIYNQTREVVDSDGANIGINLMALDDGWSRWENPGDNATHPALALGGTNNAHQTSTRYLEKGDFVRLRNVTLSFALPQALLDAISLKQASISLAVDNLLTFTEFSGMDPDIGLTQSDFSLPGLSNLKYPISKQFMLGLNINF